MSVRAVFGTLLLLGMVALASPGDAEIYRCTGPDGKLRFTGDASLRCMKQILANSRPSLPVKTATGRAVPLPTSNGFCLLANDAPRGFNGNCPNSRLPHRATKSDRLYLSPR